MIREDETDKIKTNKKQKNLIPFFSNELCTVDVMMICVQMNDDNNDNIKNVYVFVWFDLSKLKFNEHKWVYDVII